MYEIAEIVLPIFGLIGVGYLAARLRLLGPEAAAGVSEFVFRIAMPALLFRTIATADLGGISPWLIWGPYYAGVALVWGGAHLVTRRVFGRDNKAGLIAGFSAGYANLALIGVPLIHAVYGEPGTVVIALLLAVNLPFLTTIATFMHEAGDGPQGAGQAAPTRMASLKYIGLVQLKNPILIGVAVGLAWWLLGLPVSGPLGSVVDSIAQIAGPSALFVAGMSLAAGGMARQVPPAIAISVFKLVAMPALVFGFGLLIGLEPLVLQVLILSAACPTGVTAGVLAARLGTGEALASNALVISTAAGVVTISGWLFLLRYLGT